MIGREALEICHGNQGFVRSMDIRNFVPRLDPITEQDPGLQGLSRLYLLFIHLNQVPFHLFSSLHFHFCHHISRFVRFIRFFL
jgi:hypothetical protein